MLFLHAIMSNVDKTGLTVVPSSIKYTCLKSQGGDTALMEAAWMGRTEIVAQLVKCGADFNLQNKVCLFMYYITPHDVHIYATLVSHVMP